ncbi:hypothetical protein EJ04DRAFT_192226 [Polyplosphaeria fusca]|uniref:Uncharacterized protein n=1 Tax=Polyplosphaeria fusca TaxID=682080 RepID=A0A9P4V4N4_9PLEO|nr:hypothetical protein EJ04DRAFT_192226 [Polyplosphaeria fusca]
MLTSAAFALFSLLFFVVNTSAFPSKRIPSLRHERRGLPGAVYICTDKNFRGDCGWTMPNPDCHIAGTGEFAPESIGPDPGGECTLYAKSDCSDKGVKSITFPGVGEGLPKFMAIKCVANQAQTLAATATATDVDDRLAGGVGSLSRKRLKEVIQKMEEDGFKEGMIGLKKGEYV